MYRMRVIGKIECLLLVAAFSFPCFAKEEIILRGEWEDRPRSIIPQLPIQAWIEENNKDLLLEFSVNLGFVEVIVTNSEGLVVYDQMIEAKTSAVISLKEEVEGGTILVRKGKNNVYGNLFTNL